MTLEAYSTLWKKIVKGTIDPQVQSLPLKIKINFLRMQTKNGNISDELAAKELQQYCLQNEKMLEKDLTEIKKLNIFQA
ncbi:MAG: hypothetical protein JW717_14295 [Marinilabiliaceae bacterium]|nr:hypothetical protein [Marinilabiliaceae bacterium]